jgi:hypothetical protein
VSRPRLAGAPRTDGREKAITSRALMLNAIFASNWPAGIPRPTLPQVRAVLLANAAMTRAQDARDARVLASEPTGVCPEHQIPGPDGEPIATPQPGCSTCRWSSETEQEAG